MICSRCKRDADDHAAAYYHTPFGMVCWPCLTKEEKAQRDPNAVGAVNLHPRKDRNSDL